MASRFYWLNCLALAALPAFAAGPVVFRVSDPIQPGETALLFGDSIGADTVAEGWRVPESGSAPKAQRLEVLQASDISAKVVIPAEWKPGMFAVRLRGMKEPVYLNRPEVWWYLTDGATFRVFGKNLGKTPLALLGGGYHPMAMRLIGSDGYAAKFQVPADAVPGGDYRLVVSNGWGGSVAVAALPVTIKPREEWPAQRFTVKATGDGVDDDTAAFQDTLAQAGAAGGGVVFIPAGRYKITGQLTIPPRTIVRGEKREAVWLFVPKETPQIPAVFAGNRDFAIEELSIVSQTALHLIDAEKASNVRLHRLRLQHLIYAHRVNKGDTRRGIAVGPPTIMMDGEDLELSDSEVISSGMPIAVHGSRRLRIERNRLDTGRQGWYGLWNTVEAVIEDNIIEGRDLEASYGGFQQRSERIYYAGNRLQDGYGDEREALTFDSPYAPHWMGRAVAFGPNTFTTDKLWKPGELVGEAVLIAYGKGVGEYIPIAGNTEGTITLERPWDVVPDATSLVVIRVGRSQIVVTRNHFTDASAAVQLYAQSYGIIIDGNQSERTGGMYGLAWDFWWDARKTRRYSTCMFNQWLNNDLGEGFVYQQGAWMDGMLGPAADPRNGRLDPPAIAVLGNVIRNNRVRDHNTIGALLTGKHPFDLREFGTAGYLGRDTIIEGNTVSDSPVGIDVYPGYRDTVVRHNKVERCALPLSDDGQNTWVEPGARSGLGLHTERRGNVLRLRTEGWMPVISASAGGKTVELQPNVVAELPDADEVELVVRGVKMSVKASF
jgi:hypothetical protein